MAKAKPFSSLIHLVTWLVGVLVSLAVGFGMADKVLTIRWIPEAITVGAGWIVVVLTLISVILALLNKIK